MKYITKKEMLTSSRVVPVGTVIEKHSSGFYRLIIDYPLTVSLAPEFVENAPDYFEPVPTKEWTDKDMLDFAELSRCKLIEDIPEVLKYFRLKRKP